LGGSDGFGSIGIAPPQTFLCTLRDEPERTGQRWGFGAPRAGNADDAHTCEEVPMSTTEAIVVAFTAVIVAAAVWWTVRLRRRHQLRDRFGDEYEVVLEEEGGSKRRAERELAARQARHDQLEIRPLDPQLRLRYADEWRAVQARFVDDPGAALEEADRLVEDVIAERGYPIGDVDRQMADLSVEHSDVLRHYRQAHDAAQESATGRASTEDLRRGMVHYRALFEALLDDHADASGSRR
jgi:hypothetical protein